MPTIAIVGAGPGLGLSIAKVFGGHGFDVALISRNQHKLDGLAKELSAAGVDAAGFAADTSDHAQLTEALEAASARFGRIDVLEFSPHGGLAMVAPEEVTVENLAPQVEGVLYGAVTAVRAVLPAMLEAGAGTLLFTTGGGAITPYPQLATMNTAQAGLRNWVHNLHNTLSEKGVHAATVAINVMIAEQGPEGIPYRAPDDIASAYWDLHTLRDRAEHLVSA
ncbi:SDR family oxidoreductase [Streptomyces sp. NPDC096311]|uniref:SDR family oxidoreductase n=1 Tax=Streptomyces sp. NPDC096311 TaxID=3366083 RepID=UPI00382BAD3F